LAGASSDRMDALRNYGSCLGLAFQIMDDIQDVIGDPEKMGKSVGKDARDEKNTYPSVYGLDTARARCRELIEKARASMARYYDEAEVFNDILDHVEGNIA
ncbi:MAG: polyprenyl synthetase family protein, partial [Firmicutes bacterium]|nr:polyprenyl synthetase family protein [Bacillota bacterium]